MRYNASTGLDWKNEVKKDKIPVVCLECGKKFQTSKLIPECPKCGGVDIDVRRD